jgi:ABC-type multidrug transport system permease subunit
MIGSLSKSADSAGNVGTLLAFILMAVGGCIFPVFRSGGLVSVISYLTPHAHALTAYMGLMADGEPFSQLWPHAAALYGYAGVFFVVSLLRARFRT